MSEVKAIGPAGPRALSRTLTLAQARAELQQARERTQLRFAQVKADLLREADWRTIARRHPVAAAATAVAVGYFVYSLFRRR